MIIIDNYLGFKNFRNLFCIIFGIIFWDNFYRLTYRLTYKIIESKILKIFGYKVKIGVNIIDH